MSDIAGEHRPVVEGEVRHGQTAHSQISTTLDPYSHTIPAMQEEAAETVARVVFGS